MQRTRTVRREDHCPLDHTELVIKHTLAMVSKICTTTELVELWSA